MADAAAGAVEAPEAAVTTMEVAVEFCEEHSLLRGKKESGGEKKR